MMTITPPLSTPVESLRPVTHEHSAVPMIACRYCDDGMLFRVTDRFVATTQAYVRLYRCDRCGAGAVRV